MYHLGNVWWLYKSSVIGFLLIIILNSIYLSSAVYIIFKVRKILELKSVWFLFPVIWISFEYIHYDWTLSWPFMNLGNWLGQVPRLIQWYEYTGILGGSLWIILINIVIYYLLKAIQSEKWKRSFNSVLILSGLIFIPVFISFNLYNSPEDIGEKRNFRIIQPNIDPYTEKYNHKLFKGQIERQIELACFSDSADIDCYLFPESSFPVFINEDSVRNDSFLMNLKICLPLIKKVSIIGGLYSFSIQDKDTLFFNSAFYLNQDSILLRHKSKLVIGVEKMPFDEVFLFLKRLNFNFGGFNNSLSIDNKTLIFKAPDNSFSVGTIICYESVYGQFVSDFTKRGASSIVVITNDAWWGKTPAYEQILMHSKLRAIENRRILVRAGNTGISCLINSKGTILKQIEPHTVNALTVDIVQVNRMSIYTRYGDYIGKIALFCFILILIMTIYTVKFGKYKPGKL